MEVDTGRINDDITNFNLRIRNSYEMNLGNDRIAYWNTLID